MAAANLPIACETSYRDLKLSPFAGDYVECTVLVNSAFIKPIKLKVARNWTEYDQYFETNFDTLAVSYPHCDSAPINLFLLQPCAIRRFIELLAPLTLYHFRNASKQLNYECLDLRGLETCSIDVCQQDGIDKAVLLDPNPGMIRGTVKDENFERFQILYFRLFVSPKIFLDKSRRFNFVKKYNYLFLAFEEGSFNEILTEFCEALFYPGVEHVNVLMENKLNDEPAISLEKFTEFFNFCKNLKSFTWTHTNMQGIVLQDNPHISLIIQVLENWAVQATKLELFVFQYMGHYFQFDEGRLVRCVQLRKKWFWSPHCYTETGPVPVYSPSLCFKKLRKYPVYSEQKYHPDVMKTLRKSRHLAMNDARTKAILLDFLKTKRIVRKVVQHQQ